MNDLQKNLLNWAEKTVKVYVDYANAHDDAPAFYTQSPLNGITTSPELLIMGINPGSSGTYKEQKKIDSNWHLNGKDMTGEDLLRGNFCKTGKDSNVSQWEHFWDFEYGKRVLRYLSKANINPLICPEKYVLTNATFFATLQAKDIQHVLPQTCMQTLKLIEILSPKKVIMLSGYNTARKIRGLIRNSQEKEEYDISIKDYQGWEGCKYKCSRGILKFPSNKEISYLGVPHPAYKSYDCIDKFATLIANFMAE